MTQDCLDSPSTADVSNRLPKGIHVTGADDKSDPVTWMPWDYLFFNPSEHIMRIEARTFLRRSTRQIPMPHNLRFWKKLMKASQYINDSFSLFRCASIAWFTMLIQSTFIADADRTAVVRSRMSTHFEQEAMLRHCPILTDIKVVANVIEATALVVTAKLFHTIVLIASGSRTMQHQESYGVGRYHHFAVFHFREERTLIAHQLLPNTQRKFIGNMWVVQKIKIAKK